MNISLIGLGKMGQAIADCLLDSNCKITIYNRTIDKILPFKIKGAKVASSILEAVNNADIIISCLFDDKSVLDVAEQMIKCMKTNAVHVGITTVSEICADKLEKMHNDNNTMYISATVSGTPAVLRQKKATTFLAGDKSKCDIVKTIVKFYSGKVIYVSRKPSHSNMAKIIVNYLLVSSMSIFADTYTLCEKKGFDMETMQEILHLMFPNHVMGIYIDKMKNKDFKNINFPMKTAMKDVVYAKELFESSNMYSSINQHVYTEMIEALNTGLENKDWSYLYQMKINKSMK
ncbi:MAG TPA: NAD(P)-binding domain-containing protein [Victivallales bacterium]|nr:NAD(P)-binding domain-containing protein [Victivallales bacterium]